jgi:integrase
MNGSVFKRRLPSGTITWAYKFDAGRGQQGKRLYGFKGGFEKKTEAANAMRDAIKDHERTHGKVLKHVGILGTVSWSYQFRDEVKNGFASQADAEAGLADAIARQATAEQPPPAEKDPTYREYVNYWLAEHCARRLSPTTYERYVEFAKVLSKHIGDTKVNDLTTAQIQRLVHTLQDHGGMVTEKHPDGKPLAAKTTRHIATMLHTSLSEADRLGILKIRNPMENKRVKLPPLPKRDPAVVDKEKLRKLLERARTTRLYPFIVLAVASGCRRGELLALTWADWDEKTGVISITKSLEQTRAGGLRVKSTKSGKPRKFIVPETARPVLAEHRAQQEEDKRLFGPYYKENNLIFCQPGGGLYSPDRLGARVKELMGKAGLKGVSLHSLRHTNATQLLRNGVPLAEVSRRLGHADSNITLSIYNHALDIDSSAAAKVWDKALGDVVDAAKNPEQEKMVARGCTEGPVLQVVVGKKSS